MKKTTLVATAVALALGLSACGKQTTTEQSAASQAAAVQTQQVALVSGVDKQYFDQSVAFGQDFFLAVNGKWLAETEIPADKATYGSFHMLADQSQQAVKAIIDEVAAKTDLAAGSDEQKLGHFYTVLWMKRPLNSAV